MKHLLVIGAGRSTTTLIIELEKMAARYNWELTIADKNIQLLDTKLQPATHARHLDIFDDENLDEVISTSDLVISMLPARFHPLIAIKCLKYSKNLLTASYLSNEVIEMEPEVNAKGLLFLNEMGVDPGIDHMSAMRELDNIRNNGYNLDTFESFTGGLLAPESDNNPWHYKFTWNPRNVVIAGQGDHARFIQHGKYKYIPYNRLFRRTERITIPGYGKFEGYANRDSLKYIDHYGLKGVPTVYRGTLRRPGFCKAWDVFVQLGITDDNYVMKNTETMTNREFINSFLFYSASDSVRLKLLHALHLDHDSDVIEKLDWLGIFDTTPIGIKKATPAQILQHILEQKWKLEPNDKDMIVMWHKFIYQNPSDKQWTSLYSSMVCVGDGQNNTAMSKTVGLPLAIAAKMILTGQINITGVHIPTKEEIYIPVLKELEAYGITFFREKSQK